MPEVFVLPYHLVNLFTNPGLEADAGFIPMNQYMSKTKKNGGNDNCHDLFKNLRWMKDGGNGPTMNSIVGGSRADIMLKGQGRPEDFVAVWNFMCRNKEQLKKLKVNVARRRTRDDPETLVIDRTGSVYDLYFKGNSDATAIKQMIADRFFGIDCIGFVADYMIYSGLWTKYHGHEIPQWADRVFKVNVKKAADVKALNILIWNGHIAFVDWVWGMLDDTSVQVDVCQSSSGGPQCNQFVTLKETSIAGPQNRKMFRISGGAPPLPVDGHVYVMQMDGLFY